MFPSNQGGLLRGRVLFIHAFAEEMNKSRRMVALAARRLAEAGFEVVVPDLHGCGDSDGDFGDATWEGWVEETTAALAEICSDTVPAWIWGMRAGALIATSAIARSGLAPGVLFWQPILSGDQQLHQFLRLASVSAIIREESGPTTAGLRAALRDGESVEVAGYGLNAGLAAGLSTARLDLPTSYKSRVVWLETTLSEPPVLPPASRARVEQWQATGIKVDAGALSGAPFWLTQEIAECPALVEATVGAVAAATQPRA